MRVPIPSRVLPKYGAMYVAFMFAAQIIEGTDFLFAVLTAVYIVLWISAFNVAGGLEYPSGSYIFSMGIYCVGLGFTAKVLLGEPGERNLLSPIVTMLAYCLTMLILLIVCSIVRLLRPRDALIRPFETLTQLKQAAIMCMVVGYVTSVVIIVAGGTADGGLLVSGLGQLNQGYPIMSIILATTYEIRRSNGRRSINWINATGMGFYVFFGLVNFGKTSMVFAVLSWLVASVLAGYNFGKVQVIGLALGAVFFSYYLTPYSQYVRNQKTSNLSENIPIAIHYLSDLNETRQLYLDTIADPHIEDAHFFDKREGFLDRAIIVAADDQLINYTEQGHVYGLTPTMVVYANIIPHVIWRNKPSLNIGNAYLHEVGGLADDDVTTGISLSAAADAFHQAKWLGILTILPLNVFLCLILYDSFAGNAIKSTLAILPVFNMFSLGGEAGVGGPIYAATTGFIAFLSIVWVTKVAGPFLFRTFKRSGQGGGEQTVHSPIQVQMPRAKPSL